MESADTSRKGNRKERAEDQIGKGKGKERAIDQTGKGKGKERAEDQTGQNTGTLATVPTILGMSAKDAHDITQLPPSFHPAQHQGYGQRQVIWLLILRP